MVSVVEALAFATGEIHGRNLFDDLAWRGAATIRIAIIHLRSVLIVASESATSE